MFLPKFSWAPTVRLLITAEKIGAEKVNGCKRSPVSYHGLVLRTAHAGEMKNIDVSVFVRFSVTL